MNKLSSILNFIADTIGNVSMGTTATTLKGAIAETFLRTRGVYGKGTHTITTNSRLYGVSGYMGASGNLYLFIPINLAKDVTSVSFNNLVASIRTVAGGYAYANDTNMSLLITSASVFDKQPIIRIALNSSDFTATSNTPVIAEITAATMVLS